MRRSRKSKQYHNQNPPDARRVGFKLIDSGIPREGFPVLTIDEERLASVTSGGYSPVLKQGIGMAYLPASKVPKHGGKIKVAIRGKMVNALTQKLPLVEAKYHRAN